MAGTPIHDLDTEFSRRYAEVQKELDPTLFDKARKVSSQTAMDSSKPISQTEMEKFLETSPRYQPAALFTPLDIEPAISNRCFRQLVAPSLGSLEKIELQEKRIQEHFPDLSNLPIPEDSTAKDLEWIKEQQISEVHNEKASLLSFMSTIKQLNQDLSTIEGFRHQFNRG